MCDTCGCGGPPKAHGHEHGHGHGDREHMELLVHRSLMQANERQADENRAHFMDHGVFAVNLMSSPGSGKTSLIESIARRLDGRLKMGVIEGDLETDRDAARIAALGIPVRQVTTGTACHLDAAMVHEALHSLPVGSLDLLFVENVGNLVCPGLFDLGCHLNGILLSTAEGDDKVAKYPVAFRRAQFMCITKTDLLPHLDFDVARPEREARVLKGDLKIFECSPKTGEGIDRFIAYLESERASAFEKG